MGGGDGCGAHLLGEAVPHGAGDQTVHRRGPGVERPPEPPHQRRRGALRQRRRARLHRTELPPPRAREVAPVRQPRHQLVVVHVNRQLRLLGPRHGRPRPSPPALLFTKL